MPRDPSNFADDHAAMTRVGLTLASAAADNTAMDNAIPEIPEHDAVPAWRALKEITADGARVEAALAEQDVATKQVSVKHVTAAASPALHSGRPACVATVRNVVRVCCARQARRGLGDETKKLRDVPMADRGRAIGPLLKMYQAEIDRLIKHKNKATKVGDSLTSAFDI